MVNLSQYKVKTFSFENYQSIENVSDLIDFSFLYKEELKKIKGYIISKKNKWIPLSFTRLLPGVEVEEIQEYYGNPINITEDSFDFINSTDISKKQTSDDRVVNHIRFSNILGVIPILGITKKENIFVVKNTETAHEYFDFLKKANKGMKPLIGKKHYIKICFSDHTVTEGEIIEINKSNLLIKSLRTYTNLPENNVYVNVNIVPHNKHVYFISRESYIKKIEIHRYELKINPYDED